MTSKNKCHNTHKKKSKQEKNKKGDSDSDDDNYCIVEIGPRGKTGPPGPRGSRGKNVRVTCLDFYSNEATIAGVPGTTFDELLAQYGTFIIFGSLLTTILDNGIAPGPTPASQFNPPGTIVPTNILPNNVCNSPVIYDTTKNAFVFLQSGLYEITYYIQFTFQAPCFDGLTFAAFVDGIVIPQSEQTAQTGIATAAQGFNITKTFCLFFSHDTTPACSQGLNQKNSLQIRAIPNNGFDCTRVIANTASTIITFFGATFYLLTPAGILQPGNAFKIKITRISDDCM